MGWRGANQTAICCALALMATLAAAELPAQTFDSYETTTGNDAPPVLLRAGRRRRDRPAAAAN